MVLQSLFTKIFLPLTAIFTGYSTDFDCSNKANGFYVKGCSAEYFICNFGNALSRTCDYDQIFSTMTDRCVDKYSLAHCKNPALHENITFTSKCNGREDGFYADGCSYEYFHCSYYAGITWQRCPFMWHRFDQGKQICTHAKNVPECHFNGYGKHSPFPGFADPMSPFFK